MPPLFLSALRVRIPVFVHEQHCSLRGEIDADDARSWHWVAFAGDGDDDTAAVAALRLVPPPNEEGNPEKGGGTDEQGRRTSPSHTPSRFWDGREPYVKVGRVATRSEYRGQGAATELLGAALDWAGRNKDKFRLEGGEEEWRGLVLSHAQRWVKGWWEKIGFEEDEGMGVWWEEGIEHVGMWRRV